MRRANKRLEQTGFQPAAQSPARSAGTKQKCCPRRTLGAELRSSRLVSAPRQKKKGLININKTKLFSAPNKALERSFTRLHA
jgi:hypothetical protein